MEGDAHAGDFALLADGAYALCLAAPAGGEGELEPILRSHRSVFGICVCISKMQHVPFVAVSTLFGTRSPFSRAPTCLRGEEPKVKHSPFLGTTLFWG